MDYIASIAAFAISSSITPGPNNIMIMTSSLNHGIRKSIPLLMGICIGFAMMILLVGLGLGQLFNLYPKLIFAIKIIGICYLLYLALLIAQSKNINTREQSTEQISIIKGIFLQWINAKAWIVAVSAISAFTTFGSHYISQSLTITSVFFLASFPCGGVWLLFGSFLKHYLKSDFNRNLFNKTMALLLILSTLPIIKAFLF
ncbi:LysE family translocator [Photobacterium damselae]